jgi:transcriptional regulator with XRE-family HTH domain
VRHSQPRTLAEFFARKGAPTQDAIARELGITAAYVSLIASGKRQPALRLALRIESVTGVPAASLVMKAVA